MEITLMDEQTTGQTDGGEIWEKGGKVWTETVKRREKLGMIYCMSFNMQ